MAALRASTLSTNPISIVAAHRGIITKLARYFPARRFHCECASTHTVDELPDFLPDFAAQPFKLDIINMRRSGCIGAVGKHAAVDALIQARSTGFQFVIPAAGQ